jgi:type IV fimbrial biogenesis protein FimT
MGERQRGFSLLELMVVISVAGVVLSVGVPSFREFHRTGTMAAATNDLVSGVLLARVEAVKRHTPVTLCATADAAAAAPICSPGSSGAFVVFVDENGDAVLDTGEAVLLRRPAPGGAIRVYWDSSYLTYGSSGFLRRAAASSADPATRVLLCDDRGNRSAPGGSAARLVVIEAAGRGSLRQSQEDIAAAAIALGASCEP